MKKKAIVVTVVVAIALLPGGMLLIPFLNKVAPGFVAGVKGFFAGFRRG